VEVDVEVIAGAAGVLTDKTSLVSFLNGALKDSGLVVELTTDVDVCSSALKQLLLVVLPSRVSQYSSTYVHGASSDQASLEELVWVLPHNLTILASTRLTLIGVDNQVSGGVALLPALGVHE
jgi:hypothetical protein